MCVGKFQDVIAQAGVIEASAKIGAKPRFSRAVCTFHFTTHTRRLMNISFAPTVSSHIWRVCGERRESDMRRRMAARKWLRAAEHQIIYTSASFGSGTHLKIKQALNAVMLGKKNTIPKFA